MSQPLEDREREELVAFLDGELTGDEARAIERKISLDPTARAEADTLRRTWDLLDFLPRPEPSASFTEKTLTRLSAVRMETLRPLPPWRDWRTIGFGMGWLAIVGLATFAGFKGYSRLTAGGVSGGKGVSEKQEIERLPRKLREELALLKPAEREERLAALRKEQDGLRDVWTKSPPIFETWNPKPEGLVDFPMSVQKYVTEYLMPRLTKREQNALADVKGSWPKYANAILDLDKKHRHLPPLKKGPVVEGRQLQAILKQANPKLVFTQTQMRHLNEFEGKWPEYALAAKDLWRKTHNTAPMPPLGASKLDEFPDDMKAFIKAELIPLLEKADRENKNRSYMGSLKTLEGKWPEYPNRLLDLARRHGKVIPGVSIPGPPELWQFVEFGVPMKIK
jgi:hypothetical protein